MAAVLRRRQSLATVLFRLVNALDVAETVGDVVLAGGSGCAALGDEVVAVDVEDRSAGRQVLGDQDLVVAGVVGEVKFNVLREWSYHLLLVVEV